MRLSSKDIRMLQNAAKVVDAQRELMQIAKHSAQAPRPSEWRSDVGAIAAALLLIFAIAAGSWVEPPASQSVASWEPQRVVSLD